MTISQDCTTGGHVWQVGGLNVLVLLGKNRLYAKVA
jgi:hypothetical protein